MRNFSDRLEDSMRRTGSALCVGLDPDIDALPDVFLAEASRANSTEDFICSALKAFGLAAIEAVRGSAAALKPNLAFFEQYGVGGLRALASILAAARESGLPTIADAKRGDIGSTAEAYARAFLRKSTAAGKIIQDFEADALTINPYLGFDSVEPFIKACADYGKGIFILCRTSNPGSAEFQSLRDESGTAASMKTARWINSAADRALGASDLSAIGAVVGVTHAAELAVLRSAMPRSFLLIPGYGAQGGTAADAAKGFLPEGRGAIVNASRSILGNLPKSASKDEISALITSRAQSAREDLSQALRLV